MRGGAFAWKFMLMESGRKGTKSGLGVRGD